MNRSTKHSGSIAGKKLTKNTFSNLLDGCVLTAVWLRNNEALTNAVPVANLTRLNNPPLDSLNHEQIAAIAFCISSSPKNRINPVC